MLPGPIRFVPGLDRPVEEFSSEFSKPCCNLKRFVGSNLLDNVVVPSDDLRDNPFCGLVDAQPCSGPFVQDDLDGIGPSAALWC